MATIRELPDLVREFIEMAKTYLRQETVESGRLLGRFAGFSIAAGLAFALGALLLAIAGLRYIRLALPEGENWAALGYIVWALGMGLVAAIIVRVTARRISERS